MHFFDGFRTTHEVNKIPLLPYQTMIFALMLDQASPFSKARERALTPDRPKLRGTAQNPDVFFQWGPKPVNPYYLACSQPSFRIVMDLFCGSHGGRTYHAGAMMLGPRAPSA